jgi:hypothetical protein
VTTRDLQEIIATYHRYGAEHREEDFWAWDAAMNVVRGDDAERAWELVTAIVRTAPDDRLEHVGAGPVENLVETHGVVLLDRIVAEASHDPRFREALASIWLVEDDYPPGVITRLQHATGHRILVTTQAALDAIPDP